MNRSEMIQRVKDVGESLIKNAESIVSEERYLTDLHISAEITSDDLPVSICVTKEFMPERYVERFSYKSVESKK